MTTLVQNRIRKRKAGIGEPLPAHRSGPFIEELFKIDPKCRYRLIHDNFPWA